MSGNGLPRTLGLRDLTLLIIGTVIGSGIFLVPGAVLTQVHGSVPAALLAWVVGGIVSMLGALTYGELSAAHPKAGGLYVYIRDCFGAFPAFLFGWALFFAIGNGAIAALAVGFSNNLGQVISMSPAAAKWMAVLVIVAVTAVNVLGTRRSAHLQYWTTAIKVGVLLVMSVVLLWLGEGFSSAQENLQPLRIDTSLASGFGLAMLGVLWAYEGWQWGTFSAGETIDPQRNFPRAFLIGVFALIGIYLLANLAYLAALGPAAMAGSKSAAAASLAAVVGPRSAKFIALAIAISILGAINGTILTVSRVYYAMAQDGVFFKKLAEVHPRFRTPAFAVIAGSLWAAVLTATGTFEQLFTYTVFTGWIFYGLAAASIFVYRRKERDTPRPYDVPGYPLTPLLFILAAAALVLNTVIAQPRTAGIGLVIVLLGAPAYLIWRARTPAPTTSS
ncbi:MAG TPA: amino acid permease [Gemmatimonadaceae bacterium]|nr:amino acid permease [Gemmatimonadaceae bacterium]